KSLFFANTLSQETHVFSTMPDSKGSVYSIKSLDTVKTPCGEYQVPVSKPLVSNDMMPINMFMDMGSFLVGVIANRASIACDSIA
ncbi:hypothetical protein BB559_001673, partial [Furculomyces boomerangus]